MEILGATPLLEENIECKCDAHVWSASSIGEYPWWEVRVHGVGSPSVSPRDHFKNLSKKWKVACHPTQRRKLPLPFPFMFYVDRGFVPRWNSFEQAMQTLVR